MEVNKAMNGRVNVCAALPQNKGTMGHPVKLKATHSKLIKGNIF